LSSSRFRRGLQDVIKESVDLAILSGPLRAEARPLLYLPESGQDRAVEVLRAAPFYRSLDHELRSLLSDLATREQFPEDRPFPLAAIRAHSGYESESTCGHRATSARPPPAI
jgi:hypothetical protein